MVIDGIYYALALTAGGVAVWRSKHQPKPPPRYVTSQTSQGEVIETVQSTGQVKPLTEVQVGAQVSGRITKVLVDFNSKVKAAEAGGIRTSGLPYDWPICLRVTWLRGNLRSASSSARMPLISANRFHPKHATPGQRFGGFRIVCRSR